MNKKIVLSTVIVSLFLQGTLFNAHANSPRTPQAPRVQSQLPTAAPQSPVAAQVVFTTQDLQALEGGISEQVIQRPDGSETSLNATERWMLSQILFSLSWRGLMYGARKIVGQVIPLESNLGNNLRDQSEERIKQYELNILLFFKSLVDRGVLAPYLRAKFDAVAGLPLVGTKLSAMSETEKAGMVYFIVNALEGAVRTRGLTNDTRHIPYVEWTDVSARYMTMMSQGNFSSYPIAGISAADETRVLSGGIESFALRTSLIDRARHTIDIMTWAVYDDSTGEWLVNKIREKKRQGVTVRLIVDGQVALRPGYHAKLDRIQSMGVQVIRWMNPSALFAGQHRKMIVIDGVHTIAGGLNFGDEYSGLNPQVPMWLDTDIYIRGRFSFDVAQKFFDRFWDDAVGAMNLRLPTSPTRVFPEYQVGSHTPNQKQVTFLDHDPVRYAAEGSPIYRALMNDLRTARRSVDIENAYVVVIPALAEAVRQAVRRGVRVRIFTNSTESVDEKSIGEVMMISCQKLLDAGAEVYLRNGTTLHSKFMVVDGERSYITSYNMHPRSEKMEGEMAIRIDDPAFGAELTRTFERDIFDPVHSTRVTDRTTLNVPMSLKLWLLLRLMYDQL